MSTTFVTADPHWSHKGVTYFTKSDGTPLRPWNDAEEMDEAMVKLWNDTVGPKDKVYVLGDWCINRKGLPIASRLNGDKVLIKGNHDIFKLEDYTPYFRDIRAYHVLKGQNIIMSHIPVHTSQLQRFRYNIHGHLHSNRVLMHSTNGGESVIDPRYICVSVEHTDFKPVALDDILKRLT